MTTVSMDTVSMDEVVQYGPVFVLHHGQTLRLNCVTPIGTYRSITLSPGEFIIVSCDLSPVRAVVACERFARLRGLLHLLPHQQLKIYC